MEERENSKVNRRRFKRQETEDQDRYIKDKLKQDKSKTIDNKPIIDARCNKRPHKATPIPTIKLGSDKDFKAMTAEEFWDRTEAIEDIITYAEIASRAPERKWDLPDGIKDEICYKMYTSIQEILDMNPELFLYYVNDEVGTVINLFMKKDHLSEITADFEPKVRDEIIRRSVFLTNLRYKMVVYKRRAFGNINSTTDAYISAIDVRRSELIEMFGRYHSTTEVHEMIVNDWNIPIRYETIVAFRRKHSEAIKRKQESYSAEFSDIRLGYKRSRLEELSYLYHTRKIKYKEESKYSIADGREMRSVLEQIRKEIEGDKLVIDGDIRMKVDHRIETHVYSQLMNEVSIKNLILARVAAKLNVSALKLMDRLTKSFYAKYSGFVRNDDDINCENILYPSKVIYNFDEISREAPNKKLIQSTVDNYTLNRGDVERSMLIKESLIKKIIASKKSVTTVI